MRRTVFLALSGLALACDQAPGAGAAAMAADATTGSAPAPSAAPAPVATASPTPHPASSGVDRAAHSADAPSWDGSMPERPVPRTSPTVGSGMSAELQMKAIGYMAAMGQPRFDDPNADADYAAALAEKLRPIVRAMDKGAAEDKEKLDRVEVIGGGRRIDLLMASGCEAQTPSRAVVTRAGMPLSTLLAHGVLVVRCNDARAQCLQSTRDPSDVLCTTAPRHH